MTSISTLSTGLNKSDEFIKDHATHIHSRAITFRNGQVVHLNEDSAIPTVSRNDLTRYLRCQNITYFQDYDIYHSNVTLRFTNNNALTSTVAISKVDLNEKGLVQGINDALLTATTGLRLAEKSSQLHDYNGINIFIDSTIQSFQINHEGAWLLGILTTFTHDQQHVLYTLYDRRTPPIDNIQFNTQTHMSKTFYPLHNGGIHKLVVSEDNLATSQYINGHKTATIAEMNIAPTFKSKRSRQRRWTSSNEFIRYTLAAHPLEPNGSTIDEMHSPGADDRELKTVLPSCITYLLCNESIFRDIITPIVITKPVPLVTTDHVIRSATNVTDSDQVGEIQIDLGNLAIYSYKWLFRINVNNSTTLTSQETKSHLHQRVMFTFRDASGNTIKYRNIIPLSYIQARLFTHYLTNNVQNQSDDAEYTLSFDLGDSELNGVKYLCIRHYGHVKTNVADRGNLNATLQLLPLDENDTEKDFIKRKFPTRSVHITTHRSMRGDQHMTNTFNRTSTYPSTLVFLSPRSKTFDERESPWLECTTTTKISSLRLHVQDEYGQDIKTTSVANAPFYLDIAFADVPSDVNAN